MQIATTDQKTHEFTTDEHAWDIVSGLEEVTVHRLEGCEVYIGHHPHLGWLTAIIAAVGKSLLLYPFESRAAFSYLAN